MTGVVASLFFTHLLVPVIFMAWLGWVRAGSRLEFAARVLLVGLFSVHVFLSGRWDWISVYARDALLPLAAVAACIGGWRARSLPAWPARRISAWVGVTTNAVVGWLFGLLLFSYLPAGYSFDGRAVALRFPLEGGTYYIGQGGNHRALNQHHGNRSQQDALDIVALDRAGRRAHRLFPQELSRYEIFGHTVLAPCKGRVRAAVDGLPDLMPPARDPLHPAGNHVVIDCADTTLLLAHFRQGSLKVGSGAAVEAGQPLAQVGNSGNTSEPHLHLHAVEYAPGVSPLAGRAVPLTFDGRFLTRNDVVR
jgi:hypothetical protein